MVVMVFNATSNNMAGGENEVFYIRTPENGNTLKLKN